MKLTNYHKAHSIVREIQQIKESRLIEKMTETINYQEKVDVAPPGTLIYADGLCDLIPYEVSMKHIKEIRNCLVKRLECLEKQLEEL